MMNLIAWIAGSISVGILCIVSWMIGWHMRGQKDWAPPPRYNGTDVKGLYEDWEDFQASRRSDEIDAMTILNWETEIEKTRVN